VLKPHINRNKLSGFYAETTKNTQFLVVPILDEKVNKKSLTSPLDDPLHFLIRKRMNSSG